MINNGRRWKHLRKRTCWSDSVKTHIENEVFAKQMIDRDIRTNGEFYICPVYNQAIAAGLKIKPYQVSRMWGLGTPEDLEVFLRDSR